MPDIDSIESTEPIEPKKPRARRQTRQDGAESVEPVQEPKKLRAKKQLAQDSADSVEPTSEPKKTRARRQANQSSADNVEKAVPAPEQKKTRVRKQASSVAAKPTAEPRQPKVRRQATQDDLAPIDEAKRSELNWQASQDSLQINPEPKKPRTRRQSKQNAAVHLIDPIELRERKKARQKGIEPAHAQLNSTTDEYAPQGTWVNPGPLYAPEAEYNHKLEHSTKVKYSSDTSPAPEAKDVTRVKKKREPENYPEPDYGIKPAFTFKNDYKLKDEDDLPVDDPNHVRVKVWRKKRRIPRWAFVSMIAALSVLVVAGTAFGVNFFLGSMNLHAAPNVDLLAHEGVSTTDGSTVEYNGHTYAFNGNIVSIAFMGFDRKTVSGFDSTRKGQADTIMVLAIDTSNGKVTAIAIPRDAMADVDTYHDTSGDYLGTRSMQICLAFSYGDGRETSCENVLTSVQRVMYGMPINYYFALDETGISTLNDTIGGVSLKPLASIPGTNIVKGEETLLMGNNAYKYVQYRDTNVLDSSLSRQDRQIQYVQAFASKALSKANGEIGALIDLYNAVQDHSISNIALSELIFLATTVVTNGVTSVQSTSLPGEIQQGAVYAEYYLDKDGVFETILEVYYTRID